MDSTIEKLSIPLSAEAPCGTDLEDTQLLAAFDAYRLFGQMSPLSTEINWREIRDKALEALAQSKDLRLLAHLAAAQLRLAGLIGFAEALTVAGRWFAEFPETLFPRVDEDAILRKNALNAFADGKFRELVYSAVAAAERRGNELSLAAGAGVPGK